MEGFNAELATAAREVADQPSHGSALDRAVRLATEVLDDCDMAGVSVVRRDGTIETPRATDERLRRIDELQEKLREGPCVHAFERRRVGDRQRAATNPR